VIEADDRVGRGGPDACLQTGAMVLEQYPRGRSDQEMEGSHSIFLPYVCQQLFSRVRRDLTRGASKQMSCETMEVVD
jgi:hypothetical protein